MARDCNLMAGELLSTYGLNRSVRQTEQCDTHWAVATLFCSYWTASMTKGDFP